VWGIVLGVGFYNVYLPALNYEVSSGDATFDESADAGVLSAIGPFVDYYPRPKFGLHVQASPTVVLLSPGASDSFGNGVRGVGYGLMLGAGYEIWVANQWGGGWLLRVQGNKIRLEDDDGNEFESLSILPSVLFSVTLH
jgi:hypothetical protein